MVDIGRQETLQSDRDDSLGLYCPVCDMGYPESLETQHCPKDGTKLIRLTPASDPLLGRTLVERFVVDQRLGQGGMGTVYKGRQLTTGRQVAIKVIEPSRANDPQTAKRFLRECTLASQLTHPGSITVIDFGQDEDGLLFLVMELIEGFTLTELIAQGPLALQRAINIASEICSVLAAAHEHGVIHRDLKPSNIMLRTQGEIEHVVVLDFGLAKSLTDNSVLTQSGAIMGSPAYMPPELASGAPADERADLYSLGVILYEACTGRPPFTDQNTNLLIAQHVHEAPTPPDLPEPLASTIMGLLRKRPDSRPQTATEVRALLQAASTNLAKTDVGATMTLSQNSTQSPTDSRSATRRLLPMFFVLVVGIGIAVFVSLRKRATKEPAAVQEPVAIQPPIEIVTNQIAVTADARLSPTLDAGPSAAPTDGPASLRRRHRKTKGGSSVTQKTETRSEPKMDSVEDFIDPPSP